ncbi:MAG TPA: O-antigen ligase family protein [Thermoanaerobaculia bacterium]|nr:O-antigen ligase family protein [Thermoanaerobaculia bacterium]
MPMQRWVPGAERALLLVLFAWLAWLPLPFGSVVPRARVPLVVVPLVLASIAVLIRLYATRDRNNSAQPTRPWILWSTGALVFLALGALQLVPLPASVLGVASPESQELWSRASRIAIGAGVQTSAAHPISVDPRDTLLELFRLLGLYGAFITASQLIRSPERRVALACVLCGTAVFESIYGLREAALQRYEIWGWVNRLIFNRVTGTFVNPNHFAHYLAIVLPLALFLVATKWHVSGDEEVPLSRRFMNLLEHGIFTVGFALIATICCAAGILLAQSRGALLALGTGLFVVAAMLPGRRVARIGFAATAALALLVALVMFLGTQRTVARFVPNQFERETLVGRRIGISAATGVWQRFSVFGSGLGTFHRVASMEQTADLQKIYHHAHNDFLEIAATAGTLGFVIALVTLIGGYVTLVRLTFGKEARSFSWRRRAYQAAALASLTVAAVHSLFDFNFFIPSNPATLAVIAGAAVATVDYDKRTRR